MEENNYASFGMRWLAHIIDYILLNFIYFVVLAPLLAFFGISFAASNGFEDLDNLSDEDTFALVTSLMGVFFAGAVVVYIIRVLYGAFMESSNLQATVGKLAVGIKVQSSEGEKLTFVKAFLRHIGKIISGMILFIGYIMAAFTEKRQALHDFIADSVVVKK